MKPHPIQEKMTRVRRRLRRLLLVDGACRVVAGAIPAVALAALLDWSLGLADRGLRVMLSLAVIAAIGWLVYRYLWPALSARLDLVSLALRIEQLMPQLRNRLASGLEFQQTPAAAAGSSLLRSKVIERTEAAVARISPDEIMPWSRLQVPLVAAGVALAAALVVFLAAPTTAAIAVARLANPFGNTAWPRTNHLELETVVTALPRSETFEVRVVDSQDVPLPQDLRIEVRNDTDAIASVDETIPVAIADDVGVARRSEVREAFFYRAVGGDDFTMDWVQLEIVDPPSLDAIRLELTPPAYTAWPAYESSADFRALAGTQVTLTATADRPLERGWIALPDREVSLGIAGDGRTVASTSVSDWQVDESTAYRIEITDADGVVGGRYTEHAADVVADRGPTVSIDQPAGDLDVTPQAVIPISVTAKDDLGIRRVWIELADGTTADSATENASGHASDNTDASGAQRIELYERDAPAVAVSMAEWSAGERLDTQRIEYEWDLASLAAPPQQGTSLELTVMASDDLDQTGASQRRRLRVISSEQLRERLAARQEAVASSLERALELQRHALELSGRVRRDVHGGARPEAPQQDALRNDEASQREVRRLLAGNDGVREQLRAIEDALRINRADDVATSELVREVGQQIDRLTERLFPQVFDRLVTASKTVDSAGAAAADKLAPLMQDLGNAVAAAEQMQHESAEVLAAAARRLSKQASEGRLRDELAGIRGDQLALAQDTAALAGAANKSANQVAAEQARLEERQRNLAERFQRLGDMLSDAERQAGASEAQAQARAILDEAARRGIEPRMRQAGADVSAGQLGRAFDAQQQVAADIDALLEKLDELETDDAQRETDLRRLAEQASELARKQRELTERWQQREARPAEQAGAAADAALADQQRAAGQQAAELARALSMSGQQSPSATARQASEQMSAAAESQSQGQAAADSSEHAAEAEQKLAELEQQLAEQLQEAKQDEAQERLTRLWHDLHQLRDVEDAMTSQTREIEQQRSTTGRLSRGAAAQLRDLAERQHSSRDKTSEWSESLADIPTFQWALEEAAAEMAAARELLERRESGPPTQSAMTEASGRLSELLEALAPPEPQPGDEEQGGGGGGGGGGQQGGEEEQGGVMLAELVLLKTMQQRVNQQTEALGNKAARPATDADVATDVAAETAVQRAQLGERQRRLAEMTERIREAILGNPTEEDGGQKNDAAGSGVTPQPVAPDRCPGPKETDDGAISTQRLNMLERTKRTMLLATLACVALVSLALPATSAPAPRSASGNEANAEPAFDRGLLKRLTRDVVEDLSDGTGLPGQGDAEASGSASLVEPLIAEPGGAVAGDGAADEPMSRSQVANPAETLDRVAGAMREAGNLLGAEDGAADNVEVRRLQDRAVEDLDALIEAARAASQPPSSSQGQSKPAEQPSPGDPQPGKPQPGGQTTTTQAGTPGSIRTDAEAETEAQAERSRQQAQQWIERVWGHLPERQREQLRQFGTDVFLPGYETLIEEYFKRLAEEANE
ncbi:MAG: hypothetical protein R3C10_22880 [Pirellulales bacterium]